MMTSVLPAVSSVIEVVAGILTPAFQLLSDIVFPAIGAVITGVVVPVFQFLGEMIGGVVSTVVNLIIGMKDNLGVQ